MKFDPVFLPEPLGDRVSMTLLRHFNACPRSAYLTAMHKGEQSTMEMQRGRALHLICERATELMVNMGEPMVPADVVKSICDEVLGELPVPLEEHDYLREMSYRWASETAVDPSMVAACETLFSVRIGEYDVRCRIDFAEVLDGGARVVVRDYKSSRAAPGMDEVARKRPDGSFMARSFQLVMYALAMVYGLPMREQECPQCGGTGAWPVTGKGDAGGIVGRVCDVCDAKGRVEVEASPFPLASRAQHLRLEYVYPGIEDREGRMLRRGVTLTRTELEAYRASADALLARLGEAERTGDWPAVVSDHACAECPAPSMCPIPEHLRGHRGAVESVEQAATVLSGVDVVRREATALVAAVRDFAKREGISIRYGDGKVGAFGTETRTERDFDGYVAAVRAGLDARPEEFVKTTTSTPFKLRKLTAEELEEQHGGNGEGGGLDERFGAEPPF